VKRLADGEATASLKLRKEAVQVPLLKKKSDEERVAEAAAKDEKERETQERKRAQKIEKVRRAFFTTPPGEARLAFEAGDQVFQYSIDVMNQQAIIVAMSGSTTSKKESDPTAVLNLVCNEGWELVNGSFVFVEQGQQSRDKFMSSGQNVAIKGSIVGYYLFRRCEANRREPLLEPWRELAAERTAFGDSQTEAWGAGPGGEPNA
jgi:hypothetical protein